MSFMPDLRATRIASNSLANDVRNLKMAKDAAVPSDMAVTDSGKVFMWGHNPDCRLFKKLAYYKRLTHVQLPTGGHHVHMVNPEGCAKAIEEWTAANPE